MDGSFRIARGRARPLAVFSLGFNYTAKGMYAEAITEYQKYIASNPEDTATPCYLGYALAQSGRRPEALAILEKLKRTKDYVSPASFATLYAGLGDKESALAELQKGFDTHDPNLLDIDWDPTYDSLRSEPRFQEIARRVGLTP